MAITIHIFYKGAHGNAKQFVEEMIANGVVEKIRNEEGNLRYEYFYPRDDEESVLLIDSWKNQQALDIHHSTAMMGEIMRLREKYNLHTQAERYISDGGNEKDENYLRK